MVAASHFIMGPPRWSFDHDPLWARAKKLMINFKLFLASIGLPALVLFMGAMIRFHKSAPQTSATDVFSFLVVLDGAVLYDRDAFARMVAPSLQPSFALMTTISVFLCTCGWMYCLLELEDKLLDHHLHQTGSFFRLASEWFVVWIGCLALVMTHVLVLSGRASV